MLKSHNEIWRKCLEIIKDNTSEQAYATWFAPIVPIGFANNVLTIQVPSQFFYEWLEEHYLDLLKKTIRLLSDVPPIEGFSLLVRQLQEPLGTELLVLVIHHVGNAQG